LTADSRKNPIHLHPPARNRRLGLGAVAAAIYFRMVGVGRPINPDTFSDRVNAPDHFRSGLEVVGAFFRHLQLGRGSVVVLAANLGGKVGRSGDESHWVLWKWSAVVGSIGRERLAPGGQYRNQVAQIIGESLSGLNLGRIVVTAAV